jgi:hydrophobic/amphiphilic exporter-1 (mainly G- bacteria), HAE1 family
MKIIHDAIRYPVTTTVAVLLLSLFGGIALSRIPIQLTPDVEEPKITVSTVWPGASPQEMEREIIDEQEEQLKTVEGLVKMESSSGDSNGTVTLTFQVGADIDAALLRVSNRLEQVRQYPPDADKPIIRTVDANANAIAWFILVSAGDKPFTGDISTLYDFVDDQIKPEFERIPGLASSNIFGGRQHEVHVIVDPARLAARQVTVNQLAAALERENRNYSGGDFEEGKRRYIVRTVGEYTSMEEIEDVVIAVRNGTPVYVRDVARVELGFRKPQAKSFFLGEQMIAVNGVKAPGSNVLEVMKGIKATVDRLNSETLAPRGLQLVQAYDETDYIYSAIGLVQQSLWIGGFLAVAVLLLFLRSGTSTLIIAVAIPISMVGTFLMMLWFGRTLNVISLAGLAFAVGMVVDNSIVVLENIYRHRQMGKDRFLAAFDGAREVWGAVLASTLTTVAVFVPILFVQQEAGQLFRDIALALSCSVALSLLVSITVIPSMSAKIMRVAEARHHSRRHGFHNLWGFTGVAQGLTNGLTRFIYWICGSIPRRLAVVTTLTAIAVLGSVALMPKAEYLPLGNANFLFGMVMPPPGYNVDEVAELRNLYTDQLRELWETRGEQAAALPGGGVQGFFYIAMPERAFMGVRSRDPERVRELIPAFQRVNFQIPGSIAFINQASLFQRGLGQGRNIDVEITGPDLDRLIALGGEVLGRVMAELPGAQARPIPSLDLGNPEVQVVTHRRRAAEMGISNRDLGFTVSALVDGAKASEYQFEGKKIDIRVKSADSFAHRTHLLEQMPLATPEGRLITIGSVASVKETNGPVQIARSERQRAITIQVTPSDETPLQSAMETIETQILGPMRERGQLGGLYRTNLTGSADKLTQTFGALQWNFVLALIITYLLMSALFENFLYPLVIMFSVPLAALGGFLGLAAVNRFIAYQAMDVLTMLGFIILVGTVVNNAILIVHQSLNLIREEGMHSREAIRDATASRVRPIFMSVLTSVFGMLPLVLFPGAGSELYRGLGSVVVGGLIVSTIFTLVLVPSLFSLVLDATEAMKRRWGQTFGPRELAAEGD